MIILPVPSQEEILEEMMAELSDKTGINNFNPGSIARTLLEIINRRLGELYTGLNDYITESFVSTASGMWLNYIGELLNCTREVNEDEETYRARIIKQSFVFASANHKAVRLACLSVSGVRDIQIRDYERGNGTFTVYVLTDDVVLKDSIKYAVLAKAQSTKAAGIRVYVEAPKMLKIDLNFLLQKKMSITENEAKMRIKTLINDIVNRTDIGGTLNLSNIWTVSQDALSNYGQLFLVSGSVNDIEVSNLETYQMMDNEKAYLNNINIGIV